ncbi:MAG: VOC family protein [Candidatus Cloacimonetes bacterium]|nr:VOC family protein [Candidatus Cloacimonadota bacterium]MCF7814520.1 VOC family protein [Candidatus Cloacimonadota bacterium]MCF7867688.1 VOC family protein [Candidatus Cloacimonadota bacterium]MCF7883514.1 VOC family protein [Candidatus Cloacimonadota bacterium]
MKVTLITIHVSEMQESLKFYQNILGMEIINEIHPNENMRIVFLKGEGEVKIELIEDKSITQLDKFSSPVSMGIFIDDMNEILQMLKEKKVPVKRGPISVPSGSKLLFIEDPNGVEVEFIEE